MVLKIRKYLVAGLLTILPLALSIYILVVLFKLVDGILGRFLNAYFKNLLGFYIPGLGLILFILIIFLTGFISTHLFGAKLHNLFDKALGRFPLLRHIYPSIKKVFEFVFAENRVGFKKAVLVEYPRKGVWALGFIANESFKEAEDMIGKKLLNVYIPWVPNPTTGYYALVPSDEVKILNMSVSEAMRLVMSAGLLNPKELIK
jgi:uncharacterized membrane protein